MSSCGRYKRRLEDVNQSLENLGFNCQLTFKSTAFTENEKDLIYKFERWIERFEEKHAEEKRKREREEEKEDERRRREEKNERKRKNPSRAESADVRRLQPAVSSKWTKKYKSETAIHAKAIQSEEEEEEEPEEELPPIRITRSRAKNASLLLGPLPLKAKTKSTSKLKEVTTRAASSRRKEREMSSDRAKEEEKREKVNRSHTTQKERKDEKDSETDRKDLRDRDRRQKERESEHHKRRDNDESEDKEEDKNARRHHSKVQKENNRDREEKRKREDKKTAKDDDGEDKHEDDDADKGNAKINHKHRQTSESPTPNSHKRKHISCKDTPTRRGVNSRQPSDRSSTIDSLADDLRKFVAETRLSLSAPITLNIDNDGEGDESADVSEEDESPNIETIDTNAEQKDSEDAYKDEANGAILNEPEREEEKEEEKDLVHDMSENSVEDPKDDVKTARSPMREASRCSYVHQNTRRTTEVQAASSGDKNIELEKEEEQEKLEDDIVNVLEESMVQPRKGRKRSPCPRSIKETSKDKRIPAGGNVDSRPEDQKIEKEEPGVKNVLLNLKEERLTVDHPKKTSIRESSVRRSSSQTIKSTKTSSNVPSDDKTDNQKIDREEKYVAQDVTNSRKIVNPTTTEASRHSSLRRSTRRTPSFVCVQMEEPVNQENERDLKPDIIQDFVEVKPMEQPMPMEESEVKMPTGLTSVRRSTRHASKDVRSLPSGDIEMRSNSPVEKETKEVKEAENKGHRRSERKSVAVKPEPLSQKPATMKRKSIFIPPSDQTEGEGPRRKKRVTIMFPGAMKPVFTKSLQALAQYESSDDEAEEPPKPPVNRRQSVIGGIKKITIPSTFHEDGKGKKKTEGAVSEQIPRETKKNGGRKSSIAPNFNLKRNGGERRTSLFSGRPSFAPRPPVGRESYAITDLNSTSESDVFNRGMMESRKSGRLTEFEFKAGNPRNIPFMGCISEARKSEECRSGRKSVDRNPLRNSASFLESHIVPLNNSMQRNNSFASGRNSISIMEDLSDDDRYSLHHNPRNTFQLVPPDEYEEPVFSPCSSISGSPNPDDVEDQFKFLENELKGLSKKKSLRARRTTELSMMLDEHEMNYSDHDEIDMDISDEGNATQYSCRTNLRNSHAMDMSISPIERASQQIANDSSFMSPVMKRE